MAPNREHGHGHGHDGHSHGVPADADRGKLAIALGLIIGSRGGERRHTRSSVPAASPNASRAEPFLRLGFSTRGGIMAVMAVDADAPMAVKERLEAFAGEVVAAAMSRPVQRVARDRC